MNGARSADEKGRTELNRKAACEQSGGKSEVFSALLKDNIRSLVGWCPVVCVNGFGFGFNCWASCLQKG